MENQTEQNPIQQNTNTPSPLHPSRRVPQIYWFPFILSFLIFILFIGGGGILLGQYLFSNKQTITPSPPPFSSPPPIPTVDLYTESSRSATANWKTYEGTAFSYPNTQNKGYTFKYPSTWELKYNNPARPYLSFQTSDGNSGKFIINAAGHGGPGESIREIRTINKNYSSGKVAISEIEIINDKTIQGTYWFINPQLINGKQIDVPSFGFESSYPTSYQQEEFIIIIDQILSTFKFLQ